MKMKLSKSLLALGLLMLVPNLASAHIIFGSPHGFQDGVLHPLTGMDHLLAMVAVGLWAAQHRGRALWLIPLTFVSVMLLGGILGVAGVYLPGAEWAIALSVLALGALVATTTRFTPSLSMVIVGVFALFHGYAHGHEMPAAASAIPFSLGFILATALLHGLGMAAGLGLQKEPRMLRWAGAAIAASSICFFLR
ncbi:MAG TPA: HupE/UreJ family protein [Verrucomicrobiae bacterium]|jgi:urease accessory protein